MQIKYSKLSQVRFCPWFVGWLFIRNTYTYLNWLIQQTDLLVFALVDEYFDWLSAEMNMKKLNILHNKLECGELEVNFTSKRITLMSMKGVCFYFVDPYRYFLFNKITRINELNITCNWDLTVWKYNNLQTSAKS